MFNKQEDFNIILATDGYKLTHWKQYPPKSEYVFSYLESRGGKFPSTTFFGLQYYLKRYLDGQVVTMEKIDQAEERLRNYFTEAHFNREGWEYIVKEHDGRLPLRIRAAPEGLSIPTRNVLMTVENTDPSCFWLTNYVETILTQVWYPTSVATLSHAVRTLLKTYLERTGNVAGLDFMFHDFGYRGVSSQESAGLGGAAHLLSFNGTDTLAGPEVARQYYGPGVGAGAVSIPASEHSTITSWGREGEVEAMRNMLRSYPKGHVACVSDSYDVFQACAEYWGKALRMDVMKRDGVLVVRPDSGDPVEVDIRCLGLLEESFGAPKNDKGYKVLHSKVRLIQGDGINYESLSDILNAVCRAGYSAENMVFGCGGALLQKVDRDTQKFAFKCSAIRVDGEWRDVYKDPITDVGKTSKRGRLDLYRDGTGYRTGKDGEVGKSVLRDVFLDGVVLHEESFDVVRSRVRG